VHIFLPSYPPLLLPRSTPVDGCLPRFELIRSYGVNASLGLFIGMTFSDWPECVVLPTRAYTTTSKSSVISSEVEANPKNWVIFPYIHRPVTIGNAAIKQLVGHITFTSATYRLMKLSELEPDCEDYGQVPTHIRYLFMHPLLG
jgi:hypothetical protein